MYRQDTRLCLVVLLQEGLRSFRPDFVVLHVVVIALVFKSFSYPTMAQISDEETQKQVIDFSMTIGGSIETPCFALLDGQSQDPNNETYSKLTIPLTRLPAIFGRSHDTQDPHFFGLGHKKALSRKQCMIYYRDRDGGRVDWNKQTGGLAFKPQLGTDKTNLKTPKNEQPEGGFFVIESLGKNRIYVNKERVEQGESVVLSSGSAVRISTNLFYFLLPKDAIPTEIPIERKRKTPTKKRKPSITPKKAPPVKKTKETKSAVGKGSHVANFQKELDAMTVDELLQRISTGIANGIWDHNLRMTGSALTVHALRDAAMDPSIQKMYAENGPIPRSEVLNKIPEKYSQFIKHMQSKLETRSYNAHVVKCLLKGGYKRTSGSGRQIKWYLPEDIVTVPGKTAETITEDVSNVVVSESKEEVIMKTENKLTERKLIEQPNEEKNDVKLQEIESQEKVVVDIAKKDDDVVKPQEDTNKEEIEGVTKNTVVQEKPSEAAKDSVVQEKPSEAANDSVVQEMPSESVQESSTNEITIDC